MTEQERLNRLKELRKWKQLELHTLSPTVREQLEQAITELLVPNYVQKNNEAHNLITQLFTQGAQINIGDYIITQDDNRYALLHVTTGDKETDRNYMPLIQKVIKRMERVDDNT